MDSSNIADVERCVECEFDGSEWSEQSALEALRNIPARFSMATDGLDDIEVQRRPIDDVWSIAEYVDHVREILFAMRFIVATAVNSPGTDLGDSPVSRFESEPRRIEFAVALGGIDQEATSLVALFETLSATDWSASVIFDGTSVDCRWIIRHALHDSTHHLLDLARLRSQL